MRSLVTKAQEGVKIRRGREEKLQDSGDTERRLGLRWSFGEGKGGAGTMAGWTPGSFCPYTGALVPQGEPYNYGKQFSK